jgi:hypothetical protein
MKRTLAKRKLIVQKYSTHNSHASAHAALMSDLSHADPSPPAPLDVPTLECTDVYDDGEVSISFCPVAFSSFLTPAVASQHSW